MLIQRGFLCFYADCLYAASGTTTGATQGTIGNQETQEGQANTGTAQEADNPKTGTYALST